MLCEEEVALDLEVGRLNRDGTPRMFPACSKPKRNIAKGTTDPRVEFILQVLTQILIKLHLQNLEQVSTSRSKPNKNISTKVKLKNIDQT